MCLLQIACDAGHGEYLAKTDYKRMHRFFTRKFYFIFIFIFSFVMVGCVSHQSDLYRPDIQDGGPDKHVDVSNIEEVIPVAEPRTAAGNKSPYTILGKTYRVITSPENYSEDGVSSWYGTKFHGRNTSNGEIYDMYALTAAHKTLPIPSYVKVTNLGNSKSVVVRINDRGPFHGNRIIDLSYAAAKKLEFANKGTASVRVEYIIPAKGQSVQRPSASAGHKIPKNAYLQLGAFQEINAAETLKRKVSTLTNYPVNLYREVDSNGLIKVRTGPIKDNFDLVQLKQELITLGLANPYVVYWDGKEQRLKKPEEIGSSVEASTHLEGSE